MSAPTQSSFMISSFASGGWSTGKVENPSGEALPSLMPSIMSQAIPPSVTVPVPDGAQPLSQKVLNELPYELIHRSVNLCRASYWTRERLASDSRLIPHLEKELETGFPKLIESLEPHNPTAHLWLFRDTRVLVLVIRGVGSVGDSMVNFSSSLTSVPTGQVHTGFLTQFLSIEPIIRAELQSVRQHFDSLVITGYGVGGALATICLPHFASLCPETKFSCITFGSPRVGDVSFKDWFTSFRLTNSYRFILEDDPLPMFPSANRFVHCLDAICLRHDGRFELWPETTPPRWEIPFGSLVMYIVSVFVHMQWEYDDQISHACAIATGPPTRRGA